MVDGKRISNREGSTLNAHHATAQLSARGVDVGAARTTKVRDDSVLIQNSSEGGRDSV
jgi:hypothetical protein